LLAAECLFEFEIASLGSHGGERNMEPELSPVPFPHGSTYDPHRHLPSEKNSAMEPVNVFVLTLFEQV
jgi:hypothetical protein